MHSKQARRVRRKEKLERLALIKQRHRKLVLEGRERVHADSSADTDTADFDFDLEFEIK